MRHCEPEHDDPNVAIVGHRQAFRMNLQKCRGISSATPHPDEILALHKDPTSRFAALPRDIVNMISRRIGITFDARRMARWARRAAMDAAAIRGTFPGLRAKARSISETPEVFPRLLESWYKIKYYAYHRVMVASRKAVCFYKRTPTGYVLIRQHKFVNGRTGDESYIRDILFYGRGSFLVQTRRLGVWLCDETQSHDYKVPNELWTHTACYKVLPCGQIIIDAGGYTELCRMWHSSSAYTLPRESDGIIDDFGHCTPCEIIDGSIKISAISMECHIVE